MTMSASTALASINNPPVVLSTMALSQFLSSYLPTSSALEGGGGSVGGGTLGIKATWLLSFFVINVLSVMAPGRLDQQYAEELGQSSASRKAAKGKASPLTVLGGRSILTPDSWAFAIWGPIYVLEAALALLTVAQLSPDSNLLRVQGDSLKFWFLANVSQALWCCTFREKYITTRGGDGGGFSGFLGKLCSPFFLFYTAFNLSKVHYAAASNPSAPAIFKLPIALHFGWTSAATLVNINGMLAYSEVSTTVQRYAGHASLLVALSLAFSVAFTNGGSVVPLVLSWATRSVASAMENRRSSGSDGVVAQKHLGNISSALCVVAAALPLVKKYFPQGQQVLGGKFFKDL